MKFTAFFKSDEIPLEFAPEEYDQVQKIADQILNGGEAIVDLINLTKEDARRTLDFLAGLTYAIGGKIKKTENLKYHFWS